MKKLFCLCMLFVLAACSSEDSDVINEAENNVTVKSYGTSCDNPFDLKISQGSDGVTASWSNSCNMTPGCPHKYYLPRYQVTTHGAFETMQTTTGTSIKFGYTLGIGSSINVEVRNMESNVFVTGTFTKTSTGGSDVPCILSIGTASASYDNYRLENGKWGMSIFINYTPTTGTSDQHSSPLRAIIFIGNNAIADGYSNNGSFYLVPADPSWKGNGEVKIKLFPPGGTCSEATIEHCLLGTATLNSSQSSGTFEFEEINK